MAGVAAGIEGYLMGNMNPFERIMSIVGGLMMLDPGTVTDLIGAALIVLVGVFQIMRHKREGAAA